MSSFRALGEHTATPSAWERLTRPVHGEGRVPVELTERIRPPVAPAPTDRYVRFGSEEERRRRLGVAEDPATGCLISQSLNVLGTHGAAPFRAVQMPGRVLWVNFELARELGFSVPPDNRLTPELEQELLEALCLRRARPEDNLREVPSTLLYADLYGGTGLGKHGKSKGSGRAAFHPYRNIYQKGGIGLTPLGVVDPEDFAHSHGGVSLKEGLREAMTGEILHRTLTHGATRVLALIQPLDEDAAFTVYRPGEPTESRELRVSIFRAGAQLRPGHALRGYERGDRRSAGIFLRSAEQSGDLVLRTDPITGEQAADLAATQARLNAKHAAAAAEEVARTLHHGKRSTSNMLQNGGEIDLATFATQERAAPMHAGSQEDETFGKDYAMRMEELARTYEVVRRSLPADKAERLHAAPVDFGEMEQEYERSLGVQLLASTGLTPAMAEALAERAPMVAEDFAKTLLSLRALRTRGNLNYTRGPVTAAFLDTQNVLRRLPSLYFSRPYGEVLQEVEALLSPRFDQRVKVQRSQEKRVKAAASELLSAYDRVMREAVALRPTFHANEADFRCSMAVRAELENRPIESLYFSEAEARIIQAVDAFQADPNGDPTVLERLIDDGVAEGTRNFDALLRQGEARPLPEGGLELGRRVIRGVEYAVLARADGSRALKVALPLVTEPDGRYRLRVGDAQVTLAPDQLAQVRWHGTLDGWQGAAWEEPGQLTTDPAGQPRLAFLHALEPAPFAGAVEGVVRLPWDEWVKDRGENFRNYVFAVPDTFGLKALEAELARSASPTA